MAKLRARHLFRQCCTHALTIALAFNQTDSCSSPSSPGRVADTDSPGGPGGWGGGSADGCACASAGSGERGGRGSIESPTGLGSFVLQIGGAAPPKGSHSVSVLATAATLYGLASRASVELVVASPSAAYLEWVEMVFKDQYLSRGDIWYWMQQLIDQ